MEPTATPPITRFRNIAIITGIAFFISLPFTSFFSGLAVSSVSSAHTGNVFMQLSAPLSKASDSYILTHSAFDVITKIDKIHSKKVLLFT